MSDHGKSLSLRSWTSYESLQYTSHCKKKKKKKKRFPSITN